MANGKINTRHLLSLSRSSHRVSPIISIVIVAFTLTRASCVATMSSPFVRFGELFSTWRDSSASQAIIVHINTYFQHIKSNVLAYSSSTQGCPSDGVALILEKFLSPKCTVQAAWLASRNILEINTQLCPCFLHSIVLDDIFISLYLLVLDVSFRFIFCLCSLFHSSIKFDAKQKLNEFKMRK